MLTNITVGSGFEVGKYGTIQDRVAEIASQDAKVICGLVIDDSMEDDEVRVTVVAAGLSRPVPRQLTIAAASEDDQAAARQPSAKPLPRDSEYEDLDTPTFLRRQAD